MTPLTTKPTCIQFYKTLFRSIDFQQDMGDNS